MVSETLFCPTFSASDWVAGPGTEWQTNDAVCVDPRTGELPRPPLDTTPPPNPVYWPMVVMATPGTQIHFWQN